MNAEFSLPMSAEGLVLHRPPLRLVDRLLAFGEDGGLVEATVPPDSILLDENGTLDDAAMVELIAQSYGVVNGYRNLIEGNPQRMGYLVGIRSMTLLDRAVEGDRLLISVGTVKDFGAFKAAQGEVTRAGKVIAKGSFKVWMPDTEDDSETG